MELVVFVADDSGLGQVSALINRMECDKAVVVKDKKTGDHFSGGKVKTVNVDTSKNLIELREDMAEKLKRELSKEFEVALSIASGNGKEHMALISALLGIPVGVRMVVYTKEGVKFVS